MNASSTRACVGGPTKVLHVVNGEYYAGAERVQELLAEELPAFGYSASFACLKHGAFLERLERRQHEVAEFVMRSRFDVSPARRIARFARASGSAIIHTHTPRSALVGSLAAALAGLPLVHHVHSPTSRNTANPLSDRVNTMVERVALRRAQALIPVSYDLARWLREEGFSDERMTVVHNGVAPSDTAVRAEAHRELRLGMVALFRPRKGIEVLIRAMAELVTQGVPVRLRAVGEFESREYEDSVRSLAEELGVSGLIDWRGFCEDVRAELISMDLLVLPSLYGEGLPMVILEAMAVGLPVVATQVGGVAELVRNGQDGLLVRPGSVAELSHALGVFATQPDTRAAIGSEGQRRQRLEFSNEAMARRLSRIYDEVLERAGGGGRQQVAREGLEQVR